MNKLVYSIINSIQISRFFNLNRTMKINIITISLCLLGFIAKSQSTSEYTVYYNFKYSRDTLANSVYTKGEEFVLFRVGNDSRFLPTARYYNDSIIQDYDSTHKGQFIINSYDANNYVNDFLQNTNRKTVYSFINISKDITRDSVTMVYKTLDPKNYYFKQKLNLKWEISNEIDTIMGIPVVKAVTNYGGRTYIAWFAPSIPINDGPYVFMGLPGLILRVFDAQKRYIFNIAKLDFSKSKKFYTPEFISLVSTILDRQEFVKLLEDEKNSPSLLNLYNDEQKIELMSKYKKRYDFFLER